MCRSSVKGKMSSWNTMLQLLQHANEVAWIRLRKPFKSLSKRLWTGDIPAILFTNFGVAASEICLKMGVSFLRMMTQLNLRLRRECCRYVVGLLNKHKLVVLLVVSVFQTFLDLIFTVFGDFFFSMASSINSLLVKDTRSKFFTLLYHGYSILLLPRPASSLTQISLS